MTGPDAPTDLDPRVLRDAFGAFATGVTVVTGVDAGGARVGLTANSFTSVSLDPPLLLVCPARGASALPVLQASRRFAVNVLTLDQQAVAERFTQRGIDRFAVHDWHDWHGLPVLDAAMANFVCDLDAETRRRRSRDPRRAHRRAAHPPRYRAAALPARPLPPGACRALTPRERAARRPAPSRARQRDRRAGAGRTDELPRLFCCASPGASRSCSSPGGWRPTGPTRSGVSPMRRWSSSSPRSSRRWGCAAASPPKLAKADRPPAQRRRRRAAARVGAGAGGRAGADRAAVADVSRARHQRLRPAVPADRAAHRHRRSGAGGARLPSRYRRNGTRALGRRAMDADARRGRPRLYGRALRRPDHRLCAVDGRRDGGRAVGRWSRRMARRAASPRRYAAGDPIRRACLRWRAPTCRSPGPTSPTGGRAASTCSSSGVSPAPR